MPATPVPRLEAIEATLCDLIPRLSPAPNPQGRPEILPGALLWAGLLVCILRQTTSQQALWRLLSQTGLWHFPRVPVSAEAVRIRLVRSGPTVMQTLFLQVTAELATEVPDDATLAPFAPGVYAIDESTLDQVARTLPTLRDVPPGDDRLLPGKLITAFDVRTQQFSSVQTTELPRQNERVAARDLVATLPPGSLILADLGYFGFRWFDDLTDDGYHFVSKLRQKTTYDEVHLLTDQRGVRDELVWLGTYRADRAKHLQRLITVAVGTTVHRYLTNVLDPTELPVAEVVRLYARRWTIEEAFKTVKRDLGLHLLWSAQWELILTQLWGVLLIAQIASALRAQIAARAKVDLFDVSLTLLLRDLPYLVHAQGPGVVTRLAALPLTKGGYLRPSRRIRHAVPDDLPVIPPPPDLVTQRTPRYAGRRCGPGRTDLRPA
jgi:hypothetical protein